MESVKQLYQVFTTKQLLLEWLLEVNTFFGRKLVRSLAVEEANEYADNYEIYINPQIDKTKNSSIQEEIEGCLSIPSISLRIKRFDKIKVRYYNQDGKAIKKTLRGFMSKLFQHEVDHLNGRLMMGKKIIEGFIDSESSITPELFHELESLFK